MKHILYFLIILCLLPAGCIEDGVTTAPGNTPSFSVDTVKMGDVYTAQGAPTVTFKVYNPHSKSIIISDIQITDDNDKILRLNVDGLPGEHFKDVEIRSRDSIFVFVEGTYPFTDSDTPTDYLHHITFVTNGTRQSLPITARAIDATLLRGEVFDRNITLSSRRPYIIYDSIYVKPGITLTLDAGVKLRFHDGAFMTVDGTLKSNGTPDNEVELTGDRMGAVVGRVDYEIMSGQWEGVYFSPTSKENHLEYTSIRNTTSGVIVDSVPYWAGSPSLYMLNCQLRNSREYALLASHSNVVAYGCEIADAAAGVLALQGGVGEFANCTFANYYLFSALGGAALQFYHHVIDDSRVSDIEAPLLKARFDNCIIYGNGKDLSESDLAGTDVFFRNCLFKSTGSDDDHFINCLWASDPIYYTVREDYFFDYRLKPESPAVGAADASLIPTVLTCDRYGDPLGNNIGAYSTR